MIGMMQWIYFAVFKKNYISSSVIPSWYVIEIFYTVSENDTSEIDFYNCKRSANATQLYAAMILN